METYFCKHCKVEKLSKTHQDLCHWNPENKTCYTCKNYNGIIPNKCEYLAGKTAKQDCKEWIEKCRSRRKK
jgi:hypothetical protein